MTVYNSNKNHMRKDSFFDRIGELLNKDFQLRSNNLKTEHKQSFYNELSVLLNSGIDIKSALELIIDEISDLKFKLILADLKNNIVNGQSMSSAIRHHTQFTPYEFYSIEIGEEVGRLPEVLLELSNYFKNILKQKRQIITVLTYPIIVLCTSFGAIFFMLKFVVPMFSTIFQRFGSELPLITRIVLRASDYFSQYFLLILVLITSFLVFLWKIRQKEYFRKVSSAFILNIPLLGDLVRKIYIIRFCNSLSLLISSKVPLVRSIELVAKMISFYPIENSLQVILKNIIKGDSFHESLKKHSFYPSRMIYLIKAGEDVNKLDYFLTQLSTQYSEEVDYKTTVIGNLIEPFIIIFLGLIVGLILIAMYLPLFKIGSAI